MQKKDLKATVKAAEVKVTEKAETKVNEVKAAAKEASKVAQTKATEAKKAVEAKAVETKKVVEAKADETKKVVEAKAEETKKAVKTATKKTVAKAKATAVAVNTEMIVQFQNNEVNTAKVEEKVKAQFIAEGHKAASIKKVSIYVKPEEYSAYYVINEKFSGRVDLF